MNPAVPRVAPASRQWIPSPEGEGKGEGADHQLLTAAFAVSQAGPRGLIFSLILLSLLPTARAAFDAPPPTRVQIEADWLRQDAKRYGNPTPAGKITPQEDAAGAVDGVKNGQWGCHTELEENPWWQVDLGRLAKLDRLVIWNRCDAMAPRNARLRVLASEDGQNFQTFYQHNGQTFYGFTDGSPLVVPGRETPVRFIRLTLSGKTYLHLDEVEVFADGSATNVALGKPATQSSISQWSARRSAAPQPPERRFPVEWVLARGLKLAAGQQRLGVHVDRPLEVLRQIQREFRALPSAAGPEPRQSLYFRAHWAVREMALANPLLDFDAILFVKRAPTMFPHMSDQHYGWWSRPGGGIYVLEGFRAGPARVRCLTGDFPEGSFVGPDLSYDGQKLLFAYSRFHPELANERNKADKSRVPEDAFFHVFEMNVDGSGLHQLTHGKYDDFDARYLPNDELLFVSTRKGLAIQCSAWFSDSTRDNDLADSYVRCGGDNYRPVPVFTLHGMDAQGRNIHPLSAFENFEWAPSVAADGRILFTRWDYIDRFNGHFFSLWSANQDGSNPQLVYGNYTTKPQVKTEARSVPGSSKIAFMGGAHHSIYGGTLCLLDRQLGTEGDAPLTRVTPEVHFPETEANDEHYFAHPWPVSEEYFLIGWADAKLPPHGRYEDNRNPVNAIRLYLLDAFGNQELLYRDPELSSVSPLPVASRPRPTTHASLAASANAREGRLFLQDVYRGLEGVPRGTVKQLRLVAVPPKVQPQMNHPVLGVSAEDPGKYVLGTVPVETDGSAYFRLPSGVPVFLQALNEQSVAVQTMRTLTYVLPDQTLSCIGCHEPRESAPPTGRPTLASSRPPSKISPGPAGSWPLRFDQLVQPVLDRHCVECHRPNGLDPVAAKLNLLSTNAYSALLGFGKDDLKTQAFERDRSLPNQAVTAHTRLWKCLTEPKGHHGVQLAADDLNRLATWMDTYAQRVGHFSDEQERQLREFRSACADLLAESAPTH
jgi:hypothetical protein